MLPPCPWSPRGPTRSTTPARPAGSLERWLAKRNRAGSGTWTQRILRAVGLWLVAAGTASTAGFAASTTGEIVVIASSFDPTTPLAGARFTVSGPTLPFSHEVETDATGHATFALLPEGRYEVRMSMACYFPLTAAGVQVDAGRRTRLPVTLRRGTSEELRPHPRPFALPFARLASRDETAARPLPCSRPERREIRREIRHAR